MKINIFLKTIIQRLFYRVAGTRFRDVERKVNEIVSKNEVSSKKNSETDESQKYQLRFHSIENYTRLVTHLLATLPLDQAMMGAIGSPNKENFVETGDLQVDVLKKYGLQDGMTIYDLGCGSGRTAIALERDGWKGNYNGHDIESRLVSYLNSQTVHNKAQTNLNLNILAESTSVDMVFHWSVFTHLFLEEIYLYLKDIYRVLKPNGVHIFSYLSLDEEDHFQKVFLNRVNAFANQNELAHLDTFLSNDQIKIMAEKIGFRNLKFVSGSDSSKHRAFWQSLAIMQK